MDLLFNIEDVEMLLAPMVKTFTSETNFLVKSDHLRKYIL